jgi:predicted regulator of amino acid metabolism with ACT domain
MRSSWKKASKASKAPTDGTGEHLFWQTIVEYFHESPARLKVAQSILAHGFHVESPGIVKCRSIRIPLKSIGDALGIDRRTVRSTTEAICSNPKLFEFFSRVQPAGPSLEKVSKVFGYGVVTVYVESPELPGILSEVASTIADYNVAIRQVIAEDVAIYKEPCLKIITQEPLSGSVIDSLRAIKGVSRVIIDKPS